MAPRKPDESGFRRIDHGTWHEYRMDGHRLAGVTTVINAALAKPALVDWAARLVAEYVADNIHQPNVVDLWQSMGRDSLVGMLKGVPSGKRDTAAVKGTEVHALARAITDGETVDVPEELEGHVDAYLSFLDAWEPTDELTERPVVNVTHRYGGTFDLVATLPGLGRCLVDIKTGSGIFAETALQLAAYRNAEQFQTVSGDLAPMPPVDHTLALWLRADGWDLIPVMADPDTFRTFLYVSDVATRFAQPAKRTKGAAFIHPALPRPIQETDE